MREKSGNLNRLSKRTSLTNPKVQSDDLSSYQNAISRRRENFPEVRDKSGNTKFGKRGNHVRTILSIILFGLGFFPAQKKARGQNGPLLTWVFQVRWKCTFSERSSNFSSKMFISIK